MGTEQPKKKSTGTRSLKPATLLGYILHYTTAKEIADNDSVAILIEALERDIIDEALADG